MKHTTSGVRIAYPIKAADVKARERRNGYAIHAYTGNNGGGKTMCAVFDALPSLAAGRPIVSTCRILDPLTGNPHPLWVPMDDFRLLLDVEDCEVLLDEVTGVASAREGQNLPSAVLNHLQQLRKADVTLRWTTPNWKRADTALREPTQAVTTCIGQMPVEASETTRYGTQRRWKQTRLFIWRTYECKRFDEWSTSKERSSQSNLRIRPSARQVMWGPGSPVRDFYDTYEHALTVGAVNDSGRCMDCGGTRRAPVCGCSGNVKGAQVRDASFGMRRWAKLSELREHYGPDFSFAHVPDHGDADALHSWLIPETDDTPGVLLEPPTMTGASVGATTP